MCVIRFRRTEPSCQFSVSSFQLRLRETTPRLPKCMAAGTGMRSYRPKSLPGADCVNSKGVRPYIPGSTGTKVTGTIRYLAHFWHYFLVVSYFCAMLFPPKTAKKIHSELE